MKIEIFREHVLWQLGPIPVTETMLTTAAVTTGLAATAWLLQAVLRRQPDSLLAALPRLSFRWLDGLVRDIVGRPVPWLTAFSGSLFLFIAGCNLAGQLPDVRTPVASLATTSALAAIVFFVVPVAGIREQGVWGYLRHYLQPNPILFPLHVMSELSRTFALSMRLFGNMMSGHLIVVLLVALVGPIIPATMMALDLLIGMLQAYIFSVLATVYVGAALRVGEEV